MPQDLFKWEEGGVLKHHCPICQTPLSHEKCRTICLGNHVEWCHRYHSLFRKTWASRCQACKNTDEQHEKRHREIAEILAQIRKNKAVEEANAMELLASPTTPKTQRTPLTFKAVNTVNGSPMTLLETPKTSKKSRKAAKKAAKAMDRDKVVTTADIKFVAEVLHPKEDSIDDMKEGEAAAISENVEIEMNLKFTKHICNTKSARHDFIIKDRELVKADKVEIDRLLEVFEVNRDAVGKEGMLVNELAEAVKSDLAHFNDELKMNSRNRAGFWRWANKRVYRNLVENGKEWDDKHKPFDDPTRAAEERRASEAAVDADTEDDGSASRGGSMDSSIPGSSGTALTVPSSKASSSKKPAGVSIPPIPRSKVTVEAEGWSRVGKKLAKKPVSKLTLSSNGGLHHFAQKPKSVWGAPAAPNDMWREDSD